MLHEWFSPPWLGLEGETRYAMAYYRLTYEEDVHGHPRPVYVYDHHDHTQQVP